MFEYGKNNKKYWDRAKLYKQVMNKALFIIKTFYLDHSLLFLFDNATSYFVYANNKLHTKSIKKRLSSKQTWLHNR